MLSYIEKSPTTNINRYTDTPNLGAAALRNALKALHHTLFHSSFSTYLFLTFTLSLSLSPAPSVSLSFCLSSGSSHSESLDSHDTGVQAQTGFRLPGLQLNGARQWSHGSVGGLKKIDGFDMDLKDTSFKRSTCLRCHG